MVILHPFNPGRNLRFHPARSLATDRLLRRYLLDCLRSGTKITGISATSVAASKIEVPRTLSVRGV